MTILQAKNTAVYRQSDRLMLALVSIDYKFILIPLAFILLRIWSFIGDILHLYIGMSRLDPRVSLILIILGVSLLWCVETLRRMGMQLRNAMVT